MIPRVHHHIHKIPQNSSESHNRASYWLQNAPQHSVSESLISPTKR